MSNRFSRTERLTQTSDFLQVKSDGIFFKENPFWLQICKHKGLTSRVGVIATKRLGNAVQRNYAKRCIRELYRKNKKFIPEICQIVIIPRKPIFHTEFALLEKCFRKVLLKATKRL